MPSDERLARRGDRRRLAVDLDVALVGLLQPGQHADQRRLAGAVLAEQHVHLAGADREVTLSLATTPGKRLVTLRQRHDRRAGSAQVRKRLVPEWVADQLVLNQVRTAAPVGAAGSTGGRSSLTSGHQRADAVGVVDRLDLDLAGDDRRRGCVMISRPDVVRDRAAVLSSLTSRRPRPDRRSSCVPNVSAFRSSIIAA